MAFSRDRFLKTGHFQEVVEQVHMHRVEAIMGDLWRHLIYTIIATLLHLAGLQ
jgi:hypothetical protein